ncbi:hypothetical protein ACVPW9_26195, partial [Klebsiella pneumoniae]
GPDPRNFNQRVSLGRNDLLIRTFLSALESDELVKIAYLVHMNGAFGAYDIIMNGKETPGKGEKIPTNIVFYNRLIGNLKDNEMIIRYYSIDSTWRTAFVAWMVNYFDSIIG